MFVRCLEVSSRFRQLYHRLRDSQTYFEPDPQQPIGSTHGGGKNPHRSRSVLCVFSSTRPEPVLATLRHTHYRLCICSAMCLKTVPWRSSIKSDDLRSRAAFCRSIAFRFLAPLSPVLPLDFLSSSSSLFPDIDGNGQLDLQEFIDIVSVFDDSFTRAQMAKMWLEIVGLSGRCSCAHVLARAHHSLSLSRSLSLCLHTRARAN